MSAQGEALRLADLIQSRHGNDINDEAAAELRRLSAENESLRQIVQDFPPVEAELRMVMTSFLRLVAQRDALMEALKELVGHNKRFTGGVWDRARAAIKAVEENT